MTTKRSRVLLLALLAAVLAVGVAACGGDDSDADSADEAAQTVDDAAGDATDAAGDVAEDAGDVAGDAADEAGQAAEDAGEATGDAVQDAGEAVEAAGDDALGDTVTVDLDEQSSSGVSGEARISESDGQLEVSVTLDGDDGSSPRPAHIHAGSCDELGDVVYPLEDAGESPSTSTVDATLEELVDGDFAINVHESAEALENYIACGSID